MCCLIFYDCFLRNPGQGLSLAFALTILNHLIHQEQKYFIVFLCHLIKEIYPAAVNYLDDIWVIPWPLVRKHATTFICTSTSTTQEFWKFAGK